MRKITIFTLAVLGFLSVGGFFYVNQPSKAITPTIHGIYFPEGRTLVPFSLQSTLKKPFSDQSLKNKWTLMFFGYTHCPDICPTTLSVLNQTWHKLASGYLTKNLQVVFVSIDPDRDSIKSLEQYVHYFNTDFIGATGSEQDLKELTHELGVPYFVTRDEKQHTYLVDHGSMIVLVNPHGQYQAVLTAPHQVDELVEDITKIIS